MAPPARPRVAEWSRDRAAAGSRRSDLDGHLRLAAILHDEHNAGIAAPLVQTLRLVATHWYGVDIVIFISWNYRALTAASFRRRSGPIRQGTSCGGQEDAAQTGRMSLAGPLVHPCPESLWRRAFPGSRDRDAGS
ncbi:hypothetical protein Pden_5026 (plasmid) [Paracoccus denitrificans PD1222]|uniref:Uncharacterized protein n=1 Tax=Paracoccus denitrificans (strain Pd 1222) TaxID=318586 RepID=A1BC42_PARDP|nr:hypothetical protein Pden_5026 [Paracoccus denitrificans PD1222]